MYNYSDSKWLTVFDNYLKKGGQMLPRRIKNSTFLSGSNVSHLPSYTYVFYLIMSTYWEVAKLNLVGTNT